MGLAGSFSSCDVELTEEDLGFEVLAHRRRILLEIVGIVVERTVLFSSIELVRVLNHFLVESVKYIMRDHVVDDN